ncbi:MAG: ketoacyl-ACP synthase III [Verrucomicrobiae bacterium]|nr:ketoacyl-ACP synthase III [Verrucomicrobiae bacterium]
MRCQVAGTGAWLPERVLTNADLEKMVETNDEWIVSRTGIRERRLAAKEEHTSTMGARAAAAALEAAGVAASEVEMILCATITPDMPFPCTACLIQKEIGASRAFCFDLEAACTGYIYGLEVGRRFIESGAYKTVLVVASDKLSSITDWKDRNTCVLFGDGASAALLRPSTGAREILSASLGASGEQAGLLYMPGGGAQHPASAKTVEQGLHFLKMNGREVYKHAVVNMARASEEAIARAGFKPTDIAWIIPHQANLRIIQGLAERLELGMERCVVNLDRYGNISAASAGIALHEAVCDGRLKKGDLLLLVAFGAGLTWGAAVLRW